MSGDCAKGLKQGCLKPFDNPIPTHRDSYGVELAPPLVAPDSGDPDAPGAPGAPAGPDAPGAPAGPEGPAGPGAPGEPGVMMVVLLGAGAPGTTTVSRPPATVCEGAYQKKYPSSNATTTTVRMMASGAQPESVVSCV